MVIRLVWNGRLDWTCHKLPKKKRKKKKKTQVVTEGNAREPTSPWKQWQLKRREELSPLAPCHTSGTWKRAQVEAGVIPMVEKSLVLSCCFWALHHCGWCVLVSWVDIVPPETGGVISYNCKLQHRDCPSARSRDTGGSSNLSIIQLTLHRSPAPSGRGPWQSNFLPLHHFLLPHPCYTHHISTSYYVYMSKVGASLRQGSPRHQILHFAAASLYHLHKLKTTGRTCALSVWSYTILCRWWLFKCYSARPWCMLTGTFSAVLFCAGSTFHLQ